MVDGRKPPRLPIAGFARQLADAPPVPRRWVTITPFPGIGADMTRLGEEYRREFFSVESDINVWDAAAAAVRDFAPATSADAAYKLLLGLHYLHPAGAAPEMAIDLRGGSCDVLDLEIVISAISSIIADAKWASA